MSYCIVNEVLLDREFNPPAPARGLRPAQRFPGRDVRPMAGSRRPAHTGPATPGHGTRHPTLAPGRLSHMLIRFQELPVGARFEFRGHRYEKVALSMACDEERRGNVFHDDTEVVCDAPLNRPDPAAAHPASDGRHEG